MTMHSLPRLLRRPRRSLLSGLYNPPSAAARHKQARGSDSASAPSWWLGKRGLGPSQYDSRRDFGVMIVCTVLLTRSSANSVHITRHLTHERAAGLLGRTAHRKRAGARRRPSSMQKPHCALVTVYHCMCHCQSRATRPPGKDTGQTPPPRLMHHGRRWRRLPRAAA